MDVHVQIGSAERVYLHEGMWFGWSMFPAMNIDGIFLQVLHEHGFPVPTPIDQARHTILMEFIDAYPLLVHRVTPPFFFPTVLNYLIDDKYRNYLHQAHSTRN